MVKVECPFCYKKVEFKDEECLDGLNVIECPECKEGIVFNNNRHC